MMAEMQDIKIQKKYGNTWVDDTIGGKVCKFRSKGEHKLAKYFELLKQSGHIKDWEHESHKFTFGNIFSWLIDFTIRNNDDTFEYFEYKGYVEPDTKRKLYAVAEYYPQAKITLVMANNKGVKKLGVRATSCCKRVCLLSELTKGII
ncbi:MAG: hypothetical protein WC389_10905 [Lutibacter sp.]|jgi:hypothetical protein